MSRWLHLAFWRAPSPARGGNRDVELALAFVLCSLIGVEREWRPIHLPAVAVTLEVRAGQCPNASQKHPEPSTT